MRQSPVRSHAKCSSSATLEQIIDEIRKRGDPNVVAGMTRFGIQASKALGVSIPQLRDLAKKIGKKHSMAEQIWQTGIQEARNLAGMNEDPTRGTQDQKEKVVN